MESVYGMEARMKQREPLKVGDRCSVVGAGYSLDAKEWQRFDMTGTVVETEKPCGDIQVRLDGYGDALFNPRQCRRLKPRKPQPEKQERERRRGHWDGNWMVELFPGELPLSKEAVSKMWHRQWHEGGSLSEFLKDLGFPVEDK